MNHKIFKVHEIDLDNIIYSVPSHSKKNTSSIYISYNHNNINRPLLIETYELYCYENINETKSKSVPYELLLSLASTSDKKTSQIKEFIDNLDKKMISDAKNKCLFPNTNNLTYKVLLRKNEDNKHYNNGSIKIKFINNNEFNTHVFDENKVLQTTKQYHNIFSPPCVVKVILEVVSLWKNKNNVFGIYLRPHQLKVIKYPKITQVSDTIHKLKQNILETDTYNCFKSATHTDINDDASDITDSTDTTDTVTSITKYDMTLGTDTCNIQNAIHNLGNFDSNISSVSSN